MTAMITAETRAAAAPWRRRATTSAAAGGEAAQHRGDDEGEDAEQEDPLAPEEVAEAACEEEQAPEGDQVAVDHPGQARLAEVQVGLDRGKGDVDDRRVEDDHQLPQADDEEGDPPLPVAAGLIGR